MERLTKSVIVPTTGEILAYMLDSGVTDAKVKTKLGKYEDLEEQGRLLRLPCKVGDTVYCFDYPGTDVVVVVPEEVKQICVLADGVRLETSGGYYFPNMIGKIVFYTEEEAAAALEKRKGE